MRTKTLLLTAAITVAGILGASAQSTNPVYSVNVVGYVTKTLHKGFNLIAMPLKSTNYTVKYLLSGLTDDQAGAIIYKLGPAGYTQNDFYGGGTFNDDNMELPLGMSFFVYLPPSVPAVNNTFVGEVATGWLTNDVPTGFSAQASQVPQNTNVWDLGLTNATAGDILYTYGNDGIVESGFTQIDYYGDNTWSTIDNAPPIIDVGQGWIYYTTTAIQMRRYFVVP